MDFKRQEGIFNPKKIKKSIAVVGSGSVGSFTTLALAKMGANIKNIYDDDKIESHNIPNQFFRIADVGKKKTAALKELLSAFADIKVNTNGRVNISTIFEDDIVISSVDSMLARKTIWEQIKKSKPEFYIDTRMGGKVFSVFVIDMDDSNQMSAYEKTLIDDDKTEAIPCTERTIIFNVLGLASFVCNQVSKICNNQKFTQTTHFDYENLIMVKSK